MCRRVTCRRCGKAGYAGCGNHVEQVLSGVPAAERCRCAEQQPAQAAAAAAAPGRRGWRLFRRG